MLGMRMGSHSATVGPGGAGTICAVDSAARNERTLGRTPARDGAAFMVDAVDTVGSWFLLP